MLHSMTKLKLAIIGSIIDIERVLNIQPENPGSMSLVNDEKENSVSYSKFRPFRETLYIQ